jgi:sterol desaturase/sphingolipid hydroxylase (fatty acid hydroxylase superfamily)
MKKLKQRWGISSNLQLTIIFIVFSITGSSAVYAAKPFLNWLGLYRENFAPDFIWGGLIYLSLRLILIFPIYQLLLIVYGWLFGQFRFFWEFEKKMLSRMGLGFIIK